MPGVFMTPFPFWHSMGLSRDTPEDELVKAAVYQLELVLQQQTAPTDTAAIFVEPLLGEGGYIPTPHAYLKALRAICDKHKIMLVIDEVQSGYGRTGKFWCAEHSGVEGDIVVFAKGLANGFPLSGIAASKHVMGSMPPGSLGGTYAGNVVSCAAANAVLDVVRPSSLCVSPAALMLSLSFALQFESEDVLGNVTARSDQMFSHLNELTSASSTSHMVAEVRGQGLVSLAFSARGAHTAEV
jgi:4-aminobutyrate aminotransferase